MFHRSVLSRAKRLLLNRNNYYYCNMVNNLTTASAASATASTPTPTTTTTVYRDNATDILPLRVVVTAPDWKAQMMQVAKAFCPFLDHTNGVSTTEKNELTVTPLSGGLSNALFVVKSNHTRKSVLIRIHPSSSEAHNDKPKFEIVNRQVENDISAWLSSQDVGPTYYGRFLNGRVEEFFDGYITLTWKEMGAFASQIAPIMAHFHSLPIPTDILPFPSTTNNSTKMPRGDIFRRVDSWMHMAQKQQQQQAQTQNNGDNKKKDPQIVAQLLSRLCHEWTWLEEELHQDLSTTESPQARVAAQFFAQIVFTHMDMQSLNFLRPTSDNNGNTNTNGKVPQQTNHNNNSDLKVIDFEYAGWNPRGIDMANTFCEHCDMNHMQADFAKEYPSEDIQNEFLEHYIQTYSMAAAAATPSSRSPQQPPQETTSLRQQVLDYQKDALFLQAARTEIGRYTLVSHLSWAIWSVVQTYVSDIDFDYIRYAQHRLEGYEYMKAQFFSN